MALTVHQAHGLANSVTVVVSYDPLYFCIIPCNVSFIISNFIAESSPFFSLMPLANCLSTLSSQRVRFSFIDLSNVSFIFPSFISALIFKISFLLLTLWVFSFSSCFRCKLGLFI